MEAQHLLKLDQEKVASFLTAVGVTNHLFAPIAITEINGQETQKTGDAQTISQRAVGYRLVQRVEVRSADIDRVMRLDRDCTSLVEQGVLLTPFPPDFIYTKASDAKIEMLAEATSDARARAEQIARQGGRDISGLRSAKMGVFQITPLYSTEATWDGRNDTTSQEKTITAVVSVAFTMN